MSVPSLICPQCGVTWLHPDGAPPDACGNCRSFIPWRTECTPEMIADPAMGACKRMREGCIELGLWRPFYKGYVCDACMRADDADVSAGYWPFSAHGGPGVPGQYG